MDVILIIVIAGHGATGILTKAQPNRSNRR
jgi:hypothetical protein